MANGMSRVIDASVTSYQLGYAPSPALQAMRASGLGGDCDSDDGELSRMVPHPKARSSRYRPQKRGVRCIHKDFSHSQGSLTGLLHAGELPLPLVRKI